MIHPFDQSGRQLARLTGKHLLIVKSIWPAGQAVGSWQKKVQKFKGSGVQGSKIQLARLTGMHLLISKSI